MPGEQSEQVVDELSRSLASRAVPSARFSQDLGQEIRRAAREAMGDQAGMSFSDVVVELRRLVCLLRKTLVPVRPCIEFTQALGARLRRQAAELSLARQRYWRWLAAGTLVSLMGLFTAWLWRRRNGRLQRNRSTEAA